MKPFAHQRFLNENNIDVSSLPEMLQKRIEGFNELQVDLEHTQGEDRELLLDKLYRLSYEIEEDLEEHFESSLFGNSDEQTDTEELPEAPVHVAQQEVLKEPITAEPTIVTPPPTDEEIIQRMLEQHGATVHAQELQKQGFSTALDNRSLMVGKFCLRRGKYSKCYQIILSKA